MQPQRAATHGGAGASAYGAAAANAYSAAAASAYGAAAASAYSAAAASAYSECISVVCSSSVTAQLFISDQCDFEGKVIGKESRSLQSCIVGWPTKV